jgi:hypothetical protein
MAPKGKKVAVTSLVPPVPAELKEGLVADGPETWKPLLDASGSQFSARCVVPGDVSSSVKQQLFFFLRDAGNEAALQARVTLFLS